MKRFLLLATFNFIMLFNGLAQGEGISSIKLPPELDVVLRNYETHWRNRDANALADLFTQDGFILRPNREVVRGRENIAQAYKGAGGSLFLTAYAYQKEGGIAYIIGGYKGIEEGPDTGKFTLTLKLEVEKWKIFSDMDNGNQAY